MLHFSFCLWAFSRSHCTALALCTPHIIIYISAVASRLSIIAADTNVNVEYRWIHRNVPFQTLQIDVNSIFQIVFSFHRRMLHAFRIMRCAVCVCECVCLMSEHGCGCSVIGSLRTKKKWNSASLRFHFNLSTYVITSARPTSCITWLPQTSGNVTICPSVLSTRRRSIGGSSNVCVRMRDRVCVIANNQPTRRSFSSVRLACRK